MSSRSFSPFSSSVFFSFCSRFARRGKEEEGGERCCCAGIEGSLTGVIKYTEAKSSRLRLLAAPSTTTTTTLLNRIKLERTLHALHNLCSHSKKEISLLSSLKKKKKKKNNFSRRGKNLKSFFYEILFTQSGMENLAPLENRREEGSEISEDGLDRALIHLLRA